MNPFLSLSDLPSEVRGGKSRRTIASQQNTGNSHYKIYRSILSFTVTSMAWHFILSFLANVVNMALGKTSNGKTIVVFVYEYNIHLFTYKKHWFD